MPDVVRSDPGHDLGRLRGDLCRPSFRIIERQAESHQVALGLEAVEVPGVLVAEHVQVLELGGRLGVSPAVPLHHLPSRRHGAICRLHPHLVQVPTDLAAGTQQAEEVHRADTAEKMKVQLSQHGHEASTPVRPTARRLCASASVSGACQAGGRAGADRGRMTSSAIAASGLRKAYKDKIVLDGIDLDVAAGTVFSLLGPNGAGKTTTVNVLTTLMKADGGTIRVAGHDVATETKAVRAAIGVTGQFAAVDELLTGQENLQLMADLKGLPSDEGKRVVAELLERFDLTESAKKLTSTYSGGMRRKLDLAMTLVGRPKIIFLDEPTTGLDPRSRRTMWNIIRQLVAERVTIFLTTQYLDEADRLADRIAVLDQGKLVAQGTPAELKRQIPGSHVRLQFASDFELDGALRVLADATRGEEDLTLRVPNDGKSKSVRALLEQLDAHSIEVEEFSVHTPDLDDVFLALTGRTSAEVAAP